MYVFYIHWNEIYLLSFLCDVYNEVHEMTKWNAMKCNDENDD